MGDVEIVPTSSLCLILEWSWHLMLGIISVPQIGLPNNFVCQVVCVTKTSRDFESENSLLYCREKFWMKKTSRKYWRRFISD